jgi:hypothetical protein
MDTAREKEEKETASEDMGAPGRKHRRATKASPVDQLEKETMKPRKVKKAMT